MELYEVFKYGTANNTQYIISEMVIQRWNNTVFAKLEYS